ncbi:MAG: hypothetical protein ABIO46_09660, partial [Chitinophagales bacterium]
SENVFVGRNSGRANTTGAACTFMGESAGYSNTIGTANTYIGEDAGYYSTTGTSNVFVGAESGSNNTTGSFNSFFGEDAGQLTTVGNNNTFIGNLAGYNNTIGGNNVALGYNAQSGNTLTNAIAIGYNSSVTSSNSMVLGGTGANAVKVGIGVTAPAAELEVNGYTMLGTTVDGAPKIKMKKITGTTATAQGGSVSIAYGLTSSKILSVEVLVEYGANVFVPSGYIVNSGYEFNYYVNTTNVIIYNLTGNSTNILSDPVRILITYEQ